MFAQDMLNPAASPMCQVEMTWVAHGHHLSRDDRRLSWKGNRSQGTSTVLVAQLKQGRSGAGPRHC
jgi:hypothetical protein